jgi:thymidylate synthase ThyX
MRNIKVLDDLHPEDNAMLQALYSRSPASVDSHLERVKKAGSGNFMSQYYVGYGHASIGDCGSTTIFIENISMLAAKAIQDWPMYSGQESSTRYIDFSNQPIMAPVGRKDIQDKWMAFYHKATQPVLEHLRAKYPMQEGEDAKVYERAIKARSFDILRGFLPAGATTNVSWHTNLRQASDHISWMRHHPLPEVQQIADEIFEALKAKYPGSFREDREPVSEWKREVMLYEAYRDIQLAMTTEDFLVDENLQGTLKGRIFSERPKGAVLPHSIARLGNITTNFLLDFGSFRDLQRHRNGVIQMPILNCFYGVHPWYLDQLPESLREEAKTLIREQSAEIYKLDKENQFTAQYYVAMGFCVFVNCTQPVNSFIYRVELRTSKTVHPTLRAVAQKEAAWFSKRFPWVTFYPDMDLDDWDIRRGKQTIEDKV